MAQYQLFARKCDATGEGMNSGFCFGDGDQYFKYEKDANAQVKKEVLKSMKEAFDAELYYHTDWEMPFEAQYIEIDGELKELADEYEIITV